MNDQPRPARLTALLEDARRRLVETGTRKRRVLSHSIMNIYFVSFFRK